MLKSSIIVFLSIISAVCSHSAYADIYEYIDEAGITHYSDVPNNDGNNHYVLILKSETPVKPEAPISESPVTEATADKPNTTASPHNATTDNLTLSTTLTPPQLLAQIEQSAHNNQIESELIHAVMHVESAYKVHAQSHKGAQGLMQLMPVTASRLGVKNSYDPAQNIEGGAKYLRELLTLFNNDVTLAVAAYNAGENAVIRYGNRIPPYKETQAYVPKVLNVYRALMKEREQQKHVM